MAKTYPMQKATCKIRYSIIHGYLLPTRHAYLTLAVVSTVYNRVVTLFLT